jgi:hypothetical protein
MSSAPKPPCSAWMAIIAAGDGASAQAPDSAVKAVAAG